MCVCVCFRPSSQCTPVEKGTPGRKVFRRKGTFPREEDIAVEWGYSSMKGIFQLKVEDSRQKDGEGFGGRTPVVGFQGHCGWDWTGAGGTIPVEGR